MDEKELFDTPSTANSQVKEVVEDTVVKEVSIKDPFLADERKHSLLGNKQPDIVEPEIKTEIKPETQVEKPISEEPKAEKPVITEPKEVVLDKKPEATETATANDPVYMVRQFNQGSEEEEADADKFKVQDQKPKKAEKKGKGKKLRTYQQRQNRLGYAFMGIWIVGFLVFTLFPFIMTIFLSLCDVKQDIKGFHFTFVGIENYIEAFTTNTDMTPNLISYLQNIIPYTFLIVVLSFIIAYLLNKVTVGKGVLRTIYFLPVIIISGPVLEKVTSVNQAAMEAAQMSGHTVVSDYSNIFIMQIVQSYSPTIADFMGSVFDQLSLILWFTGIPIVLFINAMQKINVSIYEAAKIDSANAWQIMWKITIPMMRSIGLIVTVFTVIQLGMYSQVNSLYDVILKLTGNTGSLLGSAAAYAWVYTAVVLVIIGFIFLLFREKKGKRGA